MLCFFLFFFQAEDGIRDIGVTGVQTCALPILLVNSGGSVASVFGAVSVIGTGGPGDGAGNCGVLVGSDGAISAGGGIGRGAGRGRVEISGGAVSFKKKNN